MQSIYCLCLVLTLAACGAEWRKPGVSAEKAGKDYSECRHRAEMAQRRDSNIDTDILASRGTDWNRAGVLQTKRNDYADANSARSGDVVERCMIDKGYTTN
jgi:hypothetical protein